MKTFLHPHHVYQLQHPPEWEQIQQDEARTCGFGPKERDNVGLWISIMPYSLDTERMAEHLPEMFGQAMEKSGGASNVRPDPSLRHYGLKADASEEGKGGNFWMLAGGDVLLFASTQFPPDEEKAWRPIFDRVMSSLIITRDDELMMRKAAIEVLEELRRRFPDQDFKMDDKGGLRGQNRVVSLTNVYREVKGSPERRKEIVKNFVEGLSQSVDSNMGYETWEEACVQLLPVLKPRDYIVPGTSTGRLLISDWLADVVICYVLKKKGNKYYRFVTDWDANRWEVKLEELHKRAVGNLERLSWPRRLEGARQHDGGRLILIDTGDELASSRLLHPGLHELFSGPLGSPFLAGIPDRSTLVVFSNRRTLKQRIFRQLKKDHHASAYPITPRAFLVTADGIAPAGEAG